MSCFYWIISTTIVTCHDLVLTFNYSLIAWQTRYPSDISILIFFIFATSQFKELVKKISLATGQESELNYIRSNFIILAILFKVRSRLFHLNNSTRFFISKWRSRLALLLEASAYSKLSSNLNRLPNIFSKLSVLLYTTSFRRLFAFIIYGKKNVYIGKKSEKMLYKKNKQKTEQTVK